MLKLYHSKPPGSSPEYWEHEWRASASQAPADFSGADPLLPFFRRFLSPDRPNLEGGCGPAHWVRFWQDREYTMVGLDFAAATLGRVKADVPSLKLVAGNVNELPFPDRSLGFYYSGGVVEHFEAGPFDALREARRVLREDGTLMISVPYLNPLRRTLYASGGARRRGSLPGVFVQAHTVDDHSHMDGSFYQYVYTEREFRRLLSDHGFKVLESHGIYVLHGLLFEGLLPAFLRGRASNVDASRSEGSADVREAMAPSSSPLRVLAKRLLVEEDARGTLLPLRPVLRVIRELVANMRLYICRPA